MPFSSACPSPPPSPSPQQPRRLRLLVVASPTRARGADLRPSAAAARVLRWADAHTGEAYRMGADGPAAWDCSSFTRTAWATAAVRLPRIAQDQRDWLAAGHGTRIPPGHEQPGDLIFWDSYLGPRTIGHVVLVHDPTRHTTIEAHNTRRGVGHFTYQPRPHHRYEIWRPTLPAVQAEMRARR